MHQFKVGHNCTRGSTRARPNECFFVCFLRFLLPSAEHVLAVNRFTRARRVQSVSFARWEIPDTQTPSQIGAMHTDHAINVRQKEPATDSTTLTSANSQLEPCVQCENHKSPLTTTLLKSARAWRAPSTRSFHFRHFAFPLGANARTTTRFLASSARGLGMTGVEYKKKHISAGTSTN